MPFIQQYIICILTLFLLLTDTEDFLGPTTKISDTNFIDTEDTEKVISTTPDTLDTTEDTLVDSVLTSYYGDVADTTTLYSSPDTEDILHSKTDKQLIDFEVDSESTESPDTDNIDSEDSIAVTTVDTDTINTDLIDTASVDTEDFLD